MYRYTNKNLQYTKSVGYITIAHYRPDMAMGPFFVTQPNPRQTWANLTQPNIEQPTKSTDCSTVIQGVGVCSTPW